MGTLSRLRYVIAANVNALLEKAEDPEKLLRALIREMEDAREEARLASADLLTERKRLERLEEALTEETGQWQRRAEKAVAEQRDDLARTALQARMETEARRQAAAAENQRLGERIVQLEQDMATLKTKLADARARLKSLQAPARPRPGARPGTPPASPGERRMRRALNRFDQLQAQVDSLEARVRSYEIGGETPTAWTSPAVADPGIEAELAALKQRLATRAAEESTA